MNAYIIKKNHNDEMRTNFGERKLLICQNLLEELHNRGFTFYTSFGGSHYLLGFDFIIIRLDLMGGSICQPSPVRVSQEFRTSNPHRRHCIRPATFVSNVSWILLSIHIPLLLNLCMLADEGNSVLKHISNKPFSQRFELCLLANTQLCTELCSNSVKHHTNIFNL